MTKTVTLCSRCERELNDEERDNPEYDGDEIICDECQHELFEFTCCDCCEYGHVDDQHNILVVFEECDSMGGPARTIAPGIYKINGQYHGGPLIGSGYLFGGKLERIGEVNPDMDGKGYPCGHLCADCQANVLRQHKATCQLCQQESPACLRVKLGSWKDFKANKYQWTRPKIVCAACRHAHKGSWERVDLIAELRARVGETNGRVV